MIKSVSFNKQKYNLPKAIRWLVDNNFSRTKSFNTKNMIHFVYSERKFDDYRSKKIGNDILITYGIDNKYPILDLPPDNLNKKLYKSREGFQDTYPLKDEKDILDKDILSKVESDRSKNNDKVTFKDIPESKLNNIKTKVEIKNSNNDEIFGPGTMIYELFHGNVGFPFPNSASTFSPPLYR